jgi:hypothetical protein
VVAGGVLVEAVCRSPLENAQNITPRNSRRANAIPAIIPALMPASCRGRAWACADHSDRRSLKLLSRFHLKPGTHKGDQAFPQNFADPAHAAFGRNGGNPSDVDVGRQFVAAVAGGPFHFH